MLEKELSILILYTESTIRHLRIFTFYLTTAGQNGKEVFPYDNSKSWATKYVSQQFFNQ